MTIMTNKMKRNAEVYLLKEKLLSIFHPGEGSNTVNWSQIIGKVGIAKGKWK